MAVSTYQRSDEVLSTAAQVDDEAEHVDVTSMGKLFTVNARTSMGKLFEQRVHCDVHAGPAAAVATHRHTATL